MMEAMLKSEVYGKRPLRIEGISSSVQAKNVNSPALENDRSTSEISILERHPPRSPNEITSSQTTTTVTPPKSLYRAQIPPQTPIQTVPDSSNNDQSRFRNLIMSPFTPINRPPVPIRCRSLSPLGYPIMNNSTRKSPKKRTFKNSGLEEPGLDSPVGQQGKSKIQKLSHTSSIAQHYRVTQYTVARRSFTRTSYSPSPIVSSSPPPTPTHTPTLAERHLAALRKSVGPGRITVGTIEHPTNGLEYIIVASLSAAQALLLRITDEDYAHTVLEDWTVGGGKRAVKFESKSWVAMDPFDEPRAEEDKDGFKELVRSLRNPVGG